MSDQTDMQGYLNQALIELEAQQNHLNGQRDTLMAAKRSIMPQPFKRLEIPWLGQNTLRTDDDFSNNDCGSAVVAMLANYLGKHVSVDDVSIATGRPKNFVSLSFNELIAAGLHFGFTLKHYSGATLEQFMSDIDACLPVIALVNYRSLPASNRSDPKYNGGHYLVIVGYGSDSVVYHDPYWQTADGGAFRVLTVKEFETAYNTIAPGNTYAAHSLRLAQ